MTSSSIPPFTTSRELAAPRALVYEVHTQPAHLAHWMGAEGFRSIHSAMDLRPGGTHHYGMEGPGGLQMWGKQVFRQVEPSIAVQQHPELAGAYGVMAAVTKKVEADGLHQAQAGAVLKRARENVAASIERGEDPLVQIRAEVTRDRSRDAER